MIRLTLIFLPFLFILLPTCYLVCSLVIEKIKLELSKASDGEYKGRTQYWKIANDILED